MSVFQSVQHPHVKLNRHGVPLVPNGHPDGCDYYGKSFDLVPLRSGLLDLRYEVEREATAAGFKWSSDMGKP